MYLGCIRRVVTNYNIKLRRGAVLIKALAQCSIGSDWCSSHDKLWRVPLLPTPDHATEGARRKVETLKLIVFNTAKNEATDG